MLFWRKYTICNKKELTMNETIEILKPYLFDYVNEITQKSKRKNQYVCPLCKSETGKNSTGAFIVYHDTNSYHWFACGANGDIFNLYSEINSITDFKIIVNKLDSKYNISFSQSTKTLKKKEEKNYTKFFAIAE